LAGKVQIAESKPKTCDWCGERFKEKDKARRQRFCPQPARCRDRWWAYHRPVARIKVQVQRERRRRQAHGNARRVTRLVFRLAGEWLGERRHILFGAGKHE